MKKTLLIIFSIVILLITFELFYNPLFIIAIKGSYTPRISTSNIMGNQVIESKKLTSDDVKKIYRLQVCIIYISFSIFYFLTLFILFKCSKENFGQAFLFTTAMLLFFIWLFTPIGPIAVGINFIHYIVYTIVLKLIASLVYFLSNLKKKASLLWIIFLIPVLQGYKPGPEPRCRMECYSNIRVIQNAIEMYHIEAFDAPMTKLDLEKLVEMHYLRNIPNCPRNESSYCWKEPASYTITDVDDFFSVCVSCGDNPSNTELFDNSCIGHGTISGKAERIFVKSLYEVFLDLWDGKPEPF